MFLTSGANPLHYAIVSRGQPATVLALTSCCSFWLKTMLATTTNTNFSGQLLLAEHTEAKKKPVSNCTRYEKKEKEYKTRRNKIK